MEIVYKKLKDLKPYKNNPRKNDEAVDYVANSIQEFGFRVPIIIKSNGEIVAGHTRYKASQKLGLKEVPCVLADDLTDEQIKAFRLADNKVGEIAGWDMMLLDEEMKDINLDMEQFGFTVWDDMDINTLFHDAPKQEEKEKKKYTIVCPHCGETIVIDADYQVAE